MALIDLLNASLAKSNIGSDDPEWCQFIKDHLDYITRRSEVYQISPQVMNLYRYDLNRFLKESTVRRDEDMAWIVLLLNDLYSDLYFVDISSLIIPTDDLLENLYKTYRTIKDNAT